MARLRYYAMLLVILLALLAAPYLVMWVMLSIHPLAEQSGLTNASGGHYLYWSGFIGDTTIIAGIVLYVWHHNCHIDYCWRVARSKLESNGVHRPVCHHHARSHADSSILDRPLHEVIAASETVVGDYERGLRDAWAAVDRAIRPLGHGAGVASNSPWNAGYEQAKNEALGVVWERIQECMRERGVGWL